MSRNNYEGDTDSDDLDQAGKSNHLEEQLLTVRKQATTSRESAVLNREVDVLNREKLVTLRENAADVLDGKATLHNQEAQGAKTKRAKSAEHVAILQEANARLVISSITAYEQAEQSETDKIRMDYLAHHDILTGLPNRMLLQDRLVQTIDMARRQGGQLAVLFIDLDRFKDVNDSLGHAVGDQLLQSVAQRLLSSVRQSDTVSRQGGDEFVLMLRAIERAEDAGLSAQKILAALAQPHHIDRHDLNVSVSIGISIYPDDGQDAETLIKSADTAMFYAKENGCNTYKFFNQDMNIQAIEAQSIEAGLRRAMEKQELVLHYQPKINLHSGRIVGVEALIRWQHPEQGLLSSAQFVPIAEECGLIQPIDRWVLSEACSQAGIWLQAGLPPITVAVNTSSQEFQARDFLKNVRSTLDETGLEPRFLELELTESILMQDVKSTDFVLHALADWGVKIAVDNYGTGYSSLSYLTQFPIDTLKIDQSFVSQMTCDPDNATIVCAMISMAKKLKIRVIGGP